jgi:UDP-N-acetylglucosamine 2-epimerase (non-hydrolysing)
MPKPKIACVVGTRPEAIKIAPLVRELRRYQEAETLLISTGQHREMLDQSLAAFGLSPDLDLNIMQHGQSLADVTARCLAGLNTLFGEIQPNIVLGQGDTTTALAAAMTAFYLRIPFGHVEAGLRTPHIDNPFPEEFNRRVAGLIGTLHFAPTQLAVDHLLQEGHDPSTIYKTGNTGVDAVLLMAQLTSIDPFTDHEGRLLLLTTHRRENWGPPMRSIAEAALEIVERTPDALLIAPMHRNPTVRNVLEDVLGRHPRVRLIEPPDYREFVALMQRCTLILSDSGGVQEEAPAFGKPVLVLREDTERPEGVEAGTARLVGSDKAKIVKEAMSLLEDPEAYRKMAQAVSPYGDGHASERITGIVFEFLGFRATGSTRGEG